MTVSCTDLVWADIEEHCFSSTDREVGGILAGRIVDGTATITTALPALAAATGSANVTFTHEVWEQVHQALDQDHPGERIVGWYHSHPGFGVFLSEYDTFAHSSFFEDPAMLALVIDPLSGEAGWFAMRDGAPAEIDTRRTDRAALRPPAEAAALSSSRSRRGVASAAGFAVAAAVAGFLVGGSTSTRTVVQQLPRAAAAAAALAPPVAPVAPPITPAVAPAAAVLDYRVRRGDSWWDLAASFYGDPHRWPQLRAANHGHPSNQLDLGEHLRVPVELTP